MEIEVSIGEIVDKLSILRIKKLNITDKDKLQIVNERLWYIEDKIRNKEREKQFDSDFIELARSVYVTNDQRSEIKKEINIKYGSSFVEEKSYKEY
jgi:hypothetical protein